MKPMKSQHQPLSSPLLLNPHGSDETFVFRNVEHSLSTLLNPHGSDETYLDSFIYSRNCALLNPHGSDETFPPMKTAGRGFSS